LTGVSRDLVAKRMGTTESGVAKLEQRGVVKSNTLRRYVEAMGGELRDAEVTVGGRTYLIAFPKEAIGGNRPRPSEETLLKALRRHAGAMPMLVYIKVLRDELAAAESVAEALDVEDVHGDEA